MTNKTQQLTLILTEVENGWTQITCVEVPEVVVCEEDLFAAIEALADALEELSKVSTAIFDGWWKP